MSDLIHVGGGVFEAPKAPTFNTSNDNPAQFKATATVHRNTYTSTSAGETTNVQGLHTFSAVTNTKESTGHRNHEGSTSSVGNNMSEANGDIMSSVLSASGSPTANLKGNCTVAYAGTRISLDTAVTLGAVTKNADGSYSAIATHDQGSPSQVRNTQQETQDNLQDALPPEAVNDEALPRNVTDKIQALQQNVPEVYLDKSVAQFTTNFDVTPDQVERMASDSQLPVASVQATFTDIQQGFQKQADTTISKLGVDPQELYAWAKEHKRAELGDAVRQQVYMKSVKGYKDLVSQFKSNAPVSAARLAKVGLPANATDDTLVKLGNGMQTTVGNAKRLGLL
jgi:hypothetical protein